MPRISNLMTVCSKKRNNNFFNRLHIPLCYKPSLSSPPTITPTLPHHYWLNPRNKTRPNNPDPAPRNNPTNKLLSTTPNSKWARSKNPRKSTHLPPPSQATTPNPVPSPAQEKEEEKTPTNKNKKTKTKIKKIQRRKSNTLPPPVVNAAIPKAARNLSNSNSSFLENSTTTTNNSATLSNSPTPKS